VFLANSTAIRSAMPPIAVQPKPTSVAR
jgi:hypothetical protein